MTANSKAMTSSRQLSSTVSGSSPGRSDFVVSPVMKNPVSAINGMTLLGTMSLGSKALKPLTPPKNSSPESLR